MPGEEEMTPEHLDVVVVGAGISGIGAGYHLQTTCPDRTYAILEGRDDIGGTWDLFRYPGVRSDSDMHTLGYSFKPWTAQKAIADGPSILAYLRETCTQYGIDRHIRFGHAVTRATWSSGEARWTVEAQRRHDGAAVSFTCTYLFMCSGYYSYRGGHTPDFPGLDRFAGQVVHPQAWDTDLDYDGKQVVVIGSGATAMTLVPAMAQTAGHVTMLQRSPTYVVSRPDTDRLANTLRSVLPDKLAYELTRRKNVGFQQLVYKRTRTQPDKVKAQLIGMVRKELGPDYDVDRHFTPSYNPWDQRLCLVPNSDLFAAIRSGRASVVTDRVATFTETGIELESGGTLEADIVVTATGLQLVTLGEIDFVVDGRPVDFSRTWSYKGMAYSDVPNLASSFGYVNASWTLRSDLICAYVCRLLQHMARTGTDQCTPRLRPSDRSMPERPWIDDFSAGYMQRVMHRFPRQGDREPWVNPQSYTRDKKMFRRSPIDDGVMRFTRVEASAGRLPA
jgi:monooxygenase